MRRSFGGDTRWASLFEIRTAAVDRPGDAGQGSLAPPRKGRSAGGRIGARGGRRLGLEYSLLHERGEEAPRWARFHIVGMGLSYVLLLTAFYVDNGKNLPLWNRLPPI